MSLILKYTNIKKILTKNVNQKYYEDPLSILKEMYERDYDWQNSTVQLGLFAAFLDTSVISVRK